MTTALAPRSTAPPRILGLACRNCRRPEALGPSYVCAACFGPLDVAYDLEAIGATLTRETIERRPPGSGATLSSSRSTPRQLGACGWDRPRSSTRIASVRRSASTGFGSRTTPETRRSRSRTGPWRSPRRGPRRFGIDTLACASTGNLAGATAAAAAAVGMPAYVFIPADLEPAKVEHALAYGATVVPIDGTYDDVNRLCLQVADETGWGFVNVNLRPFYAEGSKTLAFEIAEGLGWRTPDVIVAPIASGAMYTQLARGFAQLAAVGLIERTPDPLRRRPGRRVRAGRDRVGVGDDRGRARPDAGHDRPVTRDRQPGRRPVRGRARRRDRGVDRSRFRTRRPRSPSGGSRTSRASSPRAPAA